MTTYRFIAQALTPIHVGCGTQIDPLAYILKGKHLIQFNPAQVAGELTDQERQRFIALCGRAKLKELQNYFKSKVDEGLHGLCRIDVSDEFKRAFDTKASSPSSQFRVEMMPRSVHNGNVFLPGSSLKGAVRTAVINHFANNVDALRPVVHQAVKSEKIGKKAARLEETALNRKISETQKDIFRLVHLEDAYLPPGATRIDRAKNFHPEKPGAEKIQMWFERIKSLADSPTPPSFSVVIRIDEHAMQNDKVRKLLGRNIDIEILMQACNQFYWKRLLAEADKFDGREMDSPKWKAIQGCFPKGRLNGEIVYIDPSQPFWNNREYGMHYVLLRIGRSSHFESLSVDNLRQGYNARKRQPIYGMGATRTRCMMENDNPPMPFGWLLLKLEGTSG